MPVTPSLHGHCPVVWLHVRPEAPTGWHSHSENVSNETRAFWRGDGAITFTRFAMSNGLAGVAIVAFLAVVAVPAGGVVAALEAHAAARASRQLVQLHVEAAAARVQVAVACCPIVRQSQC